MLPVPTVQDLADFTGRPVTAYPAFASSALAQATLLFQTLTHLDSFPTDADKRQLAINAIVEMADRIVLEQPYAQVKSSPFQTETIGSYSYSKSTPSTKTAQQGARTGLFWWDLAIDELMVAGSSVLAHGSVQVYPDGLYQGPEGTWRVLDEAEAEGPDAPPYIRIS